MKPNKTIREPADGGKRILKAAFESLDLARPKPNLGLLSFVN